MADGTEVDGGLGTTVSNAPATAGRVTPKIINNTMTAKRDEVTVRKKTLFTGEMTRFVGGMPTKDEPGGGTHNKGGRAKQA
jgi:hypothetical protein